MGRYRRPHLPGAAFHLTARIQNRAHLFTPELRDRIVGLLRRHVVRSDARLLAFVIMSNHIHLVVIQGEQPLSSLMQPLLRSIALITHAAYETEGHVFERRFHDRLCRDDGHLRNAIAYTHANPVRAGMCDDPSEYEWSSHRLYADGVCHGRHPPIDVRRGLMTFAGSGARSDSRVRPAYSAFVAGILDDRDCAGPETAPDPAGEPAAPGAPARRPRLHEIAQRIMYQHGMYASPELLKSRWGRRSRLALRGEFTLAARRIGYSGREIASFLDVSEPTVSRIMANARWTRGPVMS